MLRSITGGRGSVEPEAAGHDELSLLVGAVAKGDQAALRTFLVAVTPRLLQVVRRVLGGSHPDVEDVTQEAAFAVVNSLGRFRGEGTVLHFACRVAVLTAMNARRKLTAHKRHHPLEPGDVETMESLLPAPDAAIHGLELAEAVRALLLTLPAPLAEALALHAVLGCTVAEISEASGAPFETVKSRLRLARRALRTRVLADPVLSDALKELG